ncbi:uncharacterized protein LOC101451318 [Ceratitis capitata]|uniref:BESS domain-containing protein n=1 Tax=Ceratitis capitata TaxID=7213 RepID=W8BAA5_CERCA|nr:uncharacterized protein LOC101451318 [Ceratitis capitata]
MCYKMNICEVIRNKIIGAENVENSKCKITDVGVTVKINSMKLIRLVRGQEILYNSSAEGYNDKNYKEIIWERIYRALFPSYDTYKPEQQAIIRLSIRRRWKNLRDSISREVKRNATLENYSRRKESPIIAELEFLIPHIRSSYCAKLADEMGLRECLNSAGLSNEMQQEEDNLNDLIDLTDECDIKKEVQQGFDYDDFDTCDSYFMNDALSPQVTIDVGNNDAKTIEEVPRANETNESIQGTWNKEFCTVAQYKGGEFINPIDLCTGEESIENNGCVEKEKEIETETDVSSHDTSIVEPNIKRARYEAAESTKDLQGRILQLLSSLDHRERNEHETHDEDRMFLLSLVSDLKRVPATKKMVVKMEIVTAIARANQNQ